VRGDFVSVKLKKFSSFNLPTAQLSVVGMTVKLQKIKQKQKKLNMEVLVEEAEYKKKEMQCRVALKRLTAQFLTCHKQKGQTHVYGNT